MNLIFIDSFEALTSDFLILGVFAFMAFAAIISTVHKVAKPHVIVVDSSRILGGCFSVMLLLTVAGVIILWLVWPYGSESLSRTPIPTRRPIEKTEESTKRVPPPKAPSKTPPKIKPSTKPQIKKPVQEAEHPKATGHYITSHPYPFRKTRRLQGKIQAAFPDKKIELKVYPRKDSEGRPQFYLRVGPFPTKKQTDTASKRISRLADKT